MNGPDHRQQPKIARIWRGRTTAGQADEYARYMYENGIKPLAEKALGVQMLREDRGGETEFVTISYWESVEAMSRFAGDDPRRIHHLERDAEFLLELPGGVQVLNILASIGRTGGDQSKVPVSVQWPLRESVRPHVPDPRRASEESLA